MLTTTNAVATNPRAFPLSWQQQPAALLVWGFLAVVIAAYALGIDRTFLIDQANYLEYFAGAPTLDWLQNFVQDDAPLQSIVVGLLSEEVLWQVWATVLGLVFTPATAVVLTVCVLNLLVVLAVARLPNPALALIVWLLVPVGFAVTGLLQVRQGFGFAIMMYVSLRMNRPLLGTFLAALIHTTFALALPFGLIAWLCGRRQLLALLLSVAIAATVAYVGGMLFEAFGGRRLAIYDVNQTEANSVLYVFGGALCSLPSLHRLLFGAALQEPPATSRMLASLAVIHIAVIAFTAVSFFVFPLGAGRVGYLTMLLLIPMLPTMRRRDSLTGAMVFGLLLLYLVYLTVKTYLEGTYDILLRA